ncbi:MAG: formimidoylglutamase [Sphingobacteriales bacterium]|nr:formimidoylglutamase [Sphingobacteriales bacterium]
MNLKHYLRPVSSEKILKDQQFSVHQWAYQVDFYKGEPLDIEGYQIAIVGVAEDHENTDIEENCSAAPYHIRQAFYKLYSWHKHLKIIDLGNIKPHKDLHRVQERLSKIVAWLLAQRIIPIILGGTHDFTFAQFSGYEEQSKGIEMAVIDERIDLLNHSDDHESQSFLYKIFAHQPNYLYHYTQIGYQHFFVDPSVINTFEKLHFGCYRLGYIRTDLRRTEPLLRHCNLLSIDMSCVCVADAPAQKNGSPNGLSGDEICRLMYFAGLSEHISSVGIYEHYPQFDVRGQSALLIAQMVWYFIEGISQRRNEYPEKGEENFVKYIVNLEGRQDIVFIKSPRTERWWMKVPLLHPTEQLTHRYIPCLHEDYIATCQSEIPDRWLQAYLKLAEQV